MTSPKDIKDYLDEYVIGQEDAKEVISNALFLHLARSNYKIENPDTKFKKSNLLIMGPSGCGKTYIVERAAEFVKVPFFKLNAKSLSNTGFVGQSIQSFFEDFYEDCTNTAMFNYCIVFIDEFDKICQPAGDHGSTNWYLNLQYSLLKILEGDRLTKSSSSVSMGQRTKLPKNLCTDNMMFILAGNFEGLRVNRSNPKSDIGFATPEKAVKKYEPFQQELINYGVVRELVGRVSNITEVKQLSVNDYVKILKTARDSIYHQYVELFKYLGEELVLTDKELRSIARRAQKLEIGSRGLQSVFEDYLSDRISKLSVDTAPEAKLKEATLNYYKSLDFSADKISIKVLGDDDKGPIK